VDGIATREELMEVQADGVFAEGIRMGPNAQADGIQNDAGGHYYLVCSGALVEDGNILPERSLVRVNPDEPTQKF